MNFDFTEALEALGKDAAFEIINESRPTADYLFATLLPERTTASYDVDTSNLRVRATMAGFVGMDSVYPPGGVIQMSEFSEKTLKIANQIGIPEGALREIQQMLAQAALSGGNTKEMMVDEALNFFDKLIVQPHHDTMEWLRARALIDGEFTIQVGDQNVNVSYNIPSENLFNTRTGAEGYGGSSSKWWTDLRAARRILRRFRAIIMNSVTADVILYNDNNNIEVVEQDEDLGVYRISRVVGSTERRSTDARDTVQLITYDMEADVLDPTSGDSLRTIPFVADGKILCIGPNTRTRQYLPGEGSTPDPDNDLMLGYTHVGPTVEGGSPGRWGDLYTPQREPWRLEGRGVTNGIPVIEAPEKIVVLSTEIPE